MERRGFTLIELLIALIIPGIIGTALVKSLLDQTRFFAHQDALREARSASRSGLNVMLSELRILEAGGGVAAAAPQDVTLRVPYAFGIVCFASAANLVVSLLPADSMTLATAAYSGHAWRNPTTGAYGYVEPGAAIGVGNAALCTAQGITTLPGGSVALLAPGNAATPVGTPVFLFQRIRYSFLSSATVPGQLGLWRTVPATGATEELVAPFQSSARFGFYLLNRDTSQVSAPADLTQIRGLDLVLSASSSTAPQGGSGPQTFDLNAAVFFRNRLN